VMARQMRSRLERMDGAACADTFPDSKVGAVHRAPSDYHSGKASDVLTVEFTVAGVSCLGINGWRTPI
jgi:predicted 3-demethylubiquinone-9 3-methyltransferase (glyoxalase superfamily)